MTDFIASKGDHLPEINSILIDDTGTAKNLTGCTVVFLMATSSETIDTPVINAAATVVNAATGAVKYSWTGTDTNTVGSYVARWRVTDAGKLETFPNSGWITIVITDNF